MVRYDLLPLDVGSDAEDPGPNGLGAAGHVVVAERDNIAALQAASLHRHPMGWHSEFSSIGSVYQNK